MQSPSPDHQCDPTCAICGGAHPTADRKCRKRFQVPYIVRQRRRRRRRRARRGSDTAGGEEGLAEEESFSSAHRSRSASRGRSRSRGRSGSKSRSGSRGRDKGSSRSRSRGRSGSKGRVQKQMSWADKARMNIPSGQEEVFGYQPNGFCTLATWCGMLLTAGLLRLLFHWHPAWWLYCTHRRCPLQQAIRVLLVDQYKQLFVEKVQTIQSSEVNVSLMLSVIGQADSSFQESSKLDRLVILKPGGSLQSIEELVYFENKKIRYIWDAELKAFTRLRGFDKNVACSYFHQQKGLSLPEQVLR
ncbi:putative cation-transporting ATPase 13A5 [Rhipicephalus microplus]|uniref:putative cation-transporting ATPase 13A5 n=1 Tax=Rhipicephalus microplus TaxID=6941 RepID=UPI003F6C3557